MILATLIREAEMNRIRIREKGYLRIEYEEVGDELLGVRGDVLEVQRVEGKVTARRK